jgi:hypothetical protein
MTPNHPDHEAADLQSLQQLFERSQPERKDIDTHSMIANASSNEGRIENECRTTLAYLIGHKRSLRAASWIAVAASILVLWNLPMSSTNKVVFAQVRERLEAVRTLEYIETSFDGSDRSADALNGNIGPTLDEVVAKLKSDLITAEPALAKDLEFEYKVLSELQSEKSHVLYVRRIRVKGKHLQRTDGLFPVARNHVIRDGLSGLIVSFHDATKRKEVLTKQVTLSKSGEQSEADIPKIPATVDFFAQLTSFPFEAMESLPNRMINGVNVLGFRKTEQHDGRTWTRTYWVQPETKLPTEVWTELHSGSKLEQRWVMNRFVYDLPMAEELFSTDNPAGYTEADGKIYGFPAR